MMRTIKLLSYFFLLGLAGIAGYAYFGDMQPTTREIIIDVPLAPEGATGTSGG